jgi:hypothetical protein
MTTAFQEDAFQIDAFQIGEDGEPGPVPNTLTDTGKNEAMIGGEVWR